MASIYKKKAIFLLERTWDNKTKLPKKHKFSGTSGNAEVHIDSGLHGMEFFYEKTLPDFSNAGDKLQWCWRETFSEFENVLEGSYKTAWREVVNNHFTEPLPAEASKRDSSNPELDTKEGFYKAIQLFVCTILDSKTLRNLQYIYMEPAGNHKIVKDLLTPP
jgi:hypothetical protein